MNSTRRVIDQESSRYYDSSTETIKDGSTLSPTVHTGWILREEVSSNRTPNYLSLLKKGAALPLHAYSKRRETRGGMLVYKNRQQTWPFGGSTYNDTIVHKPVESSPFRATFTPDWDEVELRLLSQLKGQQWQAPVAIVEARKTADMIASGAYRIANVVRSLRRGHLGDAAEILGIKTTSRKRAQFSHAYGENPRNAASNALLEISYGWRPLVQDISDAMIALQRSIDRPSARVMSVRSSLTTRERTSDPSFVYEASPERKCIKTVETTARYSIVVSFTLDELIEAAQSVGAVNFAATAYEVTPWSFLIDYFTTLGDVINVLDATYGKTFIGGTRSVRADVITDMTNTRSSFSNLGQSGSYQLTLREKGREVLTGFPSVPLPTWQPNLNASRVTNMVALLNQQLNKLR